MHIRVAGIWTSVILTLIAQTASGQQHQNIWMKGSVAFALNDRSEWESEQMLRIQNRVEEVVPSTLQLMGWRLTYRWRHGAHSQWIVSPLCWMETFKASQAHEMSAVIRHEWRTTIGWRGQWRIKESWKVGLRLLQEARKFNGFDDLVYRSRIRPECSLQINQHNAVVAYTESFFSLGKGIHPFMEHWRLGLTWSRQFNKHWMMELGFMHAPRQVANDWGLWTDENLLIGVGYRFFRGTGSL